MNLTSNSVNEIERTLNTSRQFGDINVVQKRRLKQFICADIKKHLQNICKCLIFSVDQPRFEP